MEKDIQKKQLDLQSFRDSAQKEMQIEVNEAQGKFNEQLLSIINSLGKERGYTLVFAKEQVAFASDTADMTSELIERFNQETAKAPPAAAAPAPAGGAAKPAAPPAKPPVPPAAAPKALRRPRWPTKGEDHLREVASSPADVSSATRAASWRAWPLDEAGPSDLSLFADPRHRAARPGAPLRGSSREGRSERWKGATRSS
jgi:hypothetical protein